ncbi:MAG: AEC family transporter [Promethearchaeota archaeon]
MASIFQGLLELYLSISCGALIGFFLKKKREKILSISNKILLYFLTPVVMFISLINFEIKLDFLMVSGIVITQILVTTNLIIIAYLIIGRKKIAKRGKTGAYLLIAGWPNATVFPLPIVIAFFGEQFLPIIFIFSSSALIMRGTIGTYLSIRFGGDGSTDKHLSFKKTIIKLFTFPPTISIIVAMVLISLKITFPESIIVPLNIVKTPLSKIGGWFGGIIIGFIVSGLQKNNLKEYSRDIPVAMLIRFLLPFIFFSLFSIVIHFSEHDVIIKSILLLEVMGPPAILNVAFAVNFKLDEKFVATMLVTLTLMMLGIAPLVLFVASCIF